VPGGKGGLWRLSLPGTGPACGTTSQKNGLAGVFFPAGAGDKMIKEAEGLAQKTQRPPSE
jgi:hypothetical protein